jgi:pimeloyl-ACP methyl ester carboxylesterase
MLLKQIRLSVVYVIIEAHHRATTPQASSLWDVIDKVCKVHPKLKAAPKGPDKKNLPAREWIAQCETLVSRRGHRLAFRRQGTGPTVVLLHGFPTWSYDYAAVATNLARDHDVIALDFLGYGASDKPNPYEYSVAESADSVEDLLALLTLSSVYLVVHDYGGIVGQEIIDRQLSGKLPFGIAGLAVLNCGIVYRAYRPTRLQKMLITPILGRLIAGRVTARMVRPALVDLWGKSKLSDEEFEELWHGISLNNGHKLAHLHIRYNKERELHHRRWEAALATWDGPLHLIWGLDDPVSGRHVLELARKELPRAVVTELEGVGHFPQAEAPEAVAKAIRASTAIRASL